jgi:hypothetical protein
MMSLKFLPLQKICFITILALCLVAMASPAALAPLAVPGGQTDLVASLLAAFNSPFMC